MTTQPEALMFAAALEVSDKHPELINVNRRAADELRRLHEANQEMIETLRWLDRWMGGKPLLDCANKVRTAIKKATGETQ